MVQIQRDPYDLTVKRLKDIDPLQVSEYTGKERVVISTASGGPAVVPVSSLGPVHSFVSNTPSGWTTITITPAQLTALNTTPVVIVPGGSITLPDVSMRYWVVQQVQFRTVTGTGSTPWTVPANAQLGIKVTSSGAVGDWIFRVDMTGFLDQAPGMNRISWGTSSAIGPQGVANPLVLCQLSSGTALTGGNTALEVLISYGSGSRFV
jgi:hypothetical protein